MTEQAASADEAETSAFSPKDIALFALRAVRENVILCVAVALSVIVIGVTVVSAIPPVYDATCKIFIQDGGTLTSSLASGRDRFRPTEGTRGLQEFILARDNLLSIVREAKLFDTWPSTRAWPMKYKDKIQQALLGPPARKDMERGFAEMLSTSITAAKDGDSVRIHAQWRDGKSAYEIARLVQRNFLAARAGNDLGPFRRAIPFMEEELQATDREIEDAVSRVHSKTAGEVVQPKPAAPTPEQVKAQAAASTSAAELASLSRQLADNRRQQRALLEPRRQKIAELKVELVDMSASYSEDHPLMRQREARIASLSEIPPEVQDLRQKEGQLLAALATRGVTRTAAEANAPTTPQHVDANDPELAALQMRLGTALRKSEEVAARLESARLELASAEADFKHRYVVVEEPEIPSKPLKPMKKVGMFVAVFVVALLGAIGAATLRELRKGRLVELWQVRALGIELLGEVNLK